MPFTLTILECSSIQEYIFASNRLREAIGGSYLVDYATSAESLPLQVLLSTTFGEINTTNWKDEKELQILTDSSIQAEILYSGGGNLAVMFRDEAKAKQFVKLLSSQLLAIAPGLNLAAAHVIIDENDDLGEKLQEAFGNLKKQRNESKVGLRREGFAITRPCATTGKAATVGYPKSDGNNKEPDWLSAGATARRDFASEFEDRLTADFENSLKTKKIVEGKEILKEYCFTNQIDRLGGREGENHVAIVHIDGNGMGLLLKDASKGTLARATPTLRGFSKAVREASLDSFKKIISDLVAAVPDLKSNKGLKTSEDKNQGNREILPLRPIIYGGDDITFVCEGRIGLSLAANYLEYFSQEEWKNTNGEVHKFSACAGVAIVHTHFPLARAYDLSEELCSSAKKAAKAKKENSVKSWLDYQIIYSGMTGELDQMREDRGLFWRPWRVDKNVIDNHSWLKFKHSYEQFANWNARNQVKALREALAKDALTNNTNASATFISQAALRGKHLYEFDGLRGKIWDENKKTPYYDQIDAFDFYLEVQPR
jgi:hypothetical protein